jgi:hypothetical protein
MMKQNIMTAEICNRAKYLTSWWTGGREREREKERETGQDISPRTCTQ